MVAWLPIIRAQPICTDRNAFSLLLFAPDVEIEGEMADPFLRAYSDTLRYWGINHVVYSGRIYVRLADWLDRDYMMNMSYKATYALLEERTGARLTGIWRQRLDLPEFDDVESYDWPPCGAMRKLAIKGGEWNFKGPEPRKRE